MKMKAQAKKGVSMKARHWQLFGLAAGLSLGLLDPSAPATLAAADGQSPREFQRISQPWVAKLGVTAAGAGLIGLELWWFLYRKPQTQAAQVQAGIQEISITVDGGYTPSRIVVKAGQPVKLVFLRKDASSCLERLILPDFNQAVDLPLNQARTLEILPQEAGEHLFHCGMNMFRGSIIVEA